MRPGGGSLCYSEMTVNSQIDVLFSKTSESGEIGHADLGQHHLSGFRKGPLGACLASVRTGTASIVLLAWLDEGS